MPRPVDVVRELDEGAQQPLTGKEEGHLMRDLMVRAYVRGTVGDQRGQGMVEYALVISFVALVVITAVALLGPKVGNLFNQAGSQFAW
jgi:Flp pilus assembly pilin Flp